MSDSPEGKFVVCLACNEEAPAIVPPGSHIVEREENADGKVWVNCHHCGNRFIAYYRTDR